MKKSKKYLMALAICSLSVVAIGCSSNEKKNTANDTSETTDKKENKSSKSSNEEIVKKITEATKSIKSLKIKVENKDFVEKSGEKQEKFINLDIVKTSNPTVIKITGTMIGLGKSFEVSSYITEDAIYDLNIKDKKWYNVKNEETKREINSQKDADRLNVIIEIINELGKDLKIEEKDSEYEITFKGSDDVREILKKALKKGQLRFAYLLDELKLDKFELELKVDKNTFMPKEQRMLIVLNNSTAGKDGSFGVELKSKISDINKVEPIKIPDEVKNAE